MSKSGVLAILCAGMILSAPAGAAELAAGSTPSCFTPVGNSIYFAASTDFFGRELWKYDLDSGLTDMVCDLNYGQFDGLPVELEVPFSVCGDALVFVARGNDGSGIWRSDGASTGTRLLYPTPLDSELRPDFMGHGKDTVLLAVHHSAGWRTLSIDRVGTAKVVEQAALGTQPQPRWLAAQHVPGILAINCVGGSFQAKSVVYTDGSDAGTQEYLESPLRGRSLKLCSSGILFEESTFFITESNQCESTLWRWGKDRLGPIPVVESAMHQVRLIEVVGGLRGGVLCLAENETYGRELWRYDLDSGAFALFGDLFPGPASSDPYKPSPVLNGRIYFSAADGLHGRELWLTDGSIEGTHMVRDIYPGDGDSHPFSLRALGDSLYFMANHPQYNEELWSTDGTDAGTHLVLDMIPGPEHGGPFGLTVINDRIYMRGVSVQHGYEFWVSDGSAEGTYMLADINRPRDVRASSRPRCFSADVEGVIFVADDIEGHEVLWKSDGSESGTVAMATLPESAGTAVETAVCGGSYFVKMLASDGATLWRSSESGWIDVFGSTAKLSAESALIEIDDALYCVASDDLTGTEIWRVMGDAAILAADIAPGSMSSHPMHLTNIAGALFFAAREEVHGVEPWVLRNEIPERLADIAPGTASSNPRGFAGEASGPMYFVADDGATGPEVWQRGADGAVQLLKDIYPINQGATLPSPRELVYSDNLLYFVASDGQHGGELWVSGGTPESTRMARDMNPGMASSHPRSLTSTEGGVVFCAYSPKHGWKLWKSDGSTDGTYMPRLEHNFLPCNIIMTQAGLFAAAAFQPPQEGRLGMEFLDISRVRTHDLWPGPESSSPAELTESGGKIFFRADDGWHGEEPWVFDTANNGRPRIIKDLLPDVLARISPRGNPSAHAAHRPSN